MLKFTSIVGYTSCGPTYIESFFYHIWAVYQCVELKIILRECFLNVVNLYAPTDYREQSDFIDLLSRKIISLTDTYVRIMLSM